jgi:CubicO group peptidase (beta-lactamase class C family)
MTNIDEIGAAADRFLAERLPHTDVPGMAVGLCDRGGNRWTGSYGVTAVGGPPVRTSTMFSVQSTSKLVTATTALIAVRQGLLDLDVPISTYLPDFTVGSTFEADPVAGITLRRLLDHTAGFTHEAPIGSNYVPGGDFAEHVRSISETQLRFRTGNHHEYSNLGVDLAGQLIQHVSGRAFPDFAAAELFAPLGMSRSTFDSDVWLADNDRALGHWARLTAAGTHPPRVIPMVPSGGLYTCVDDALSFLHFQLRNEDERLTEFPKLTPGQRTGYGLCLYVDQWDGEVAVHHHGGAGFGFLSQLFWMPDLGVGGVILSNSVDHDLQNELAAYVVRTFAGRSEADGEPGPVRPLPSTTVSDPALVGTYVGRLGDVIELTQQDGPEPLVLADPLGHPRYLVNDFTGDVYYRIFVPDVPPARLPEASCGTYFSTVQGVPVSPYRLRQDGERAWLDVARNGSLDNALSLQLESLGDNRYLSATGEILSIGPNGVSYANIPLDRQA